MVVGTRGVPASYSGFETCVESVGKRLAAAGHSVIVYCRAGRTGGRYRQYLGMELVTLPAVRTKGLETLTHSLLSTAHALVREHPDAALVFGVGNAVFCRAFRSARVPVAINVDGADWARRKWGLVGRRYLRWSEKLATTSADAIIADAHSIAAYYERAYQARSTFIPYGADIPAVIGTATLERFRLKPREYFLAVGRMVPENGFHHLIEAHHSAQANRPLVIVGDAPYSEAYKKSLRELAGPNVIFTGYLFGSAYHELSAGAYAFLFGAEVGGTHPVLIEQLAHGNCVLARWTESNAEVMGDAGLFFHDQAELEAGLRRLIQADGMVDDYRERARRQAEAYSWDRIARQYEDLLSSLVDVERRRPVPGGA